MEGKGEKNACRHTIVRCHPDAPYMFTCLVLNARTPLPPPPSPYTHTHKHTHIHTHTHKHGICLHNRKKEELLVLRGATNYTLQDGNYLYRWRARCWNIYLFIYLLLRQ